MGSDYYKKAKILDEDEGDWESAIQVCEEGIERGFFDCAYEKGLILLLNQDPSDIDWGELIETFELGARGGEERCHYELAKLYSGKENPNLKNYGRSLDEFCYCTIKKEDIPIVRKMLVQQRVETQKKGPTYSLSLLNKCDKLIGRCRGDNGLKEFVLSIRKDCANDAFLSWAKEIDACTSLKDLREVMSALKPTEARFDKFDRLFLRGRDFGYPFLYFGETTLEEIKWFLSLCEKAGEGVPWLMGKICNGLGQDKIDLLKRLKELTKRYPAWTLDIREAAIGEINRLAKEGKIEEADKIIAILKISAKDCVQYTKEIAKRREINEARALADADFSFPNGSENISKAFAKALEIQTKYNDETLLHYLVPKIENAKNFVDLEVVFAALAMHEISLSSLEESEWCDVPKNKLRNQQTGNYFLVFCPGIPLDGSYMPDRFVQSTPGFERLFLNSNSPFQEGRNAFSIFDWSKNYHARKDDFSYPNNQMVRFFEKPDLKEFVKTYRSTYNAILGFCMNEEAAILCAEAEVKPVMVNDVIDYPSAEFLEKEIEEMKRAPYIDFRSNYLYYYSPVRDIKFCADFHSPHFRTLIVYFKAFNPTGYFNDPLRGQDERKLKKRFSDGEFYDSNKKGTLLANIETFAEWFDDLPIAEEDIVMRVPASEETCCDEGRPMNKIVAEIVKRHGKGKNGNRYLIRSEEKPRHNAYGGVGREISTQLKTLKVVDNEGVLEGKTIYLFDDICTSGTSMVACSHLLYEAGAGRVVCFAIVKTENPEYPLKPIE